MTGLIAYVGFIGGFSVIALSLYYGFRAIKFL
ncbi:cytochrome b6-f complex subunit PetL [Geminocystis sp. NIES-3708]|nr:cytochrome b6-f complex subunit PetL [Geminocystis sp. NIES-3708]